MRCRMWPFVSIGLLAASVLQAQGYSADKPLGASAQETPAYLAHAGIEQRLGQPLPLSATFTDQTGRTGELMAIAELSNGNIVTGSYDQTAKIWDRRGLCLATLSGHTDSVTCVAGLTNGWFVTGSQDGTAKIWNETGECMATLQGHRGRVSALAVFPDGRIVTASRDGTARFWNFASVPAV